jgi:hypothetical protein
MEMEFLSMLEDYSNTSSSLQNNSDLELQPYADADTPLPYMEIPSPPSNEQPTPSVQQPAPLTEEARIAATYQLGNVLKLYKGESTAFTTDGLPSATRTYVRGARGLAIVNLSVPIILITTLVIWLLTRTPPWPLILLCLLILAPWLGNILSRLPKDVIVSLQNTEFYLCTNGLMIIRGTHVQALRWEQIQAVQRNMTSDLLRYSYILYPDEGKPVTLDNSLVGPELKELGKAIEREVSQRLLPKSIAAYEAGQTLNFGPINVTRQGLTLENEQQSLSWESFACLEFFNGYLLTIKEGKTASAWHKIEIATMLNFCVFLPLVIHIANSLRARAHQSENGNPTSYPSLVPPSKWSVYEYGIPYKKRI